MERQMLSDAEIANVIERSASLRQAGAQLGFGTTWARRQAKRLGVRSRYRLGAERLPDNATLARLLGEARSVQGLATQLGVTPECLQARADDLGIDARRSVRSGLPDDETLTRDICEAESVSALARRYGLPYHTVRNQSRRLGVRPGDPIPPPRVVEHEDPEALRRRAAEHLALFEAAAEELAQVERQRDALARREAELRVEVERLRAGIRDLTEEPVLGLEAVLAEAQSTGAVVILPKAMRAARKATHVDVEKLRAGLIGLRDAYVPWRRGEISEEAMIERLVPEGYEVTPTLTTSGKLKSYGYAATWAGREVLLDRHLKWGVDPARLIRIYFHYDEATGIAVVGWLPTHLQVTKYS